MAHGAKAYPRRVTPACRRCRRDKTRCESLDLGRLGGSESLRSDKPCHRCSVLGKECIRDRGTSVAAEPHTPAPEPVLTALARGDKSRGGAEDERPGPPAEPVLAVLDKWHLSGNPQGSRRIPMPSTNDDKEPVGTAVRASSPLYDQPLEYTLALLRHAYGEGFGNSIDSSFNLGTALCAVATALQQAKVSGDLAARYSNFLMYHPHLPDLDDLATSSLGGSLLVATILHLCSCDGTLQTHITHLRDLVIVRLTPSLHGAMALDLLALHAPLGILPWQPIPGANIDILRSVPIAIRRLIPSSLSQAERVMQFSVDESFTSKEVWCWLSLCELESSRSNATYTFTTPPTELQRAAKLCQTFLDLPNWNEEPGRLLGKLYMCERLSMLQIETTTIVQIRQAYKQLLMGVPTTDLTVTLINILSAGLDSINDLKTRVDRHVNDQFVHGDAQSAWESYRTVLRHTTRGSLHRAVIWFLYGSSALKEVAPLALIDLDKAVDEALLLARQPSQISHFFSQVDDESKPFLAYSREILQERMNAFETVLIASLRIQNLRVGVLVPWHTLASIVLVATKVLFQFEIGTSRASTKANRPKLLVVRSEQWNYLAEQSMSHLKTFEKEGDSLSSACADLGRQIIRQAADARQDAERQKAVTSPISESQCSLLPSSYNHSRTTEFANTGSSFCDGQLNDLGLFPPASFDHSDNALFNWGSIFPTGGESNTV